MPLGLLGTVQLNIFLGQAKEGNDELLTISMSSAVGSDLRLKDEKMNSLQSVKATAVTTTGND